MSARSIGESASLACLLEAIAAKPGNVHRGADFADMTFQDLAISAVVIGQVFHGAAHQSIGQLVRSSVERIHREVGRNTYLGTVLLLGPLAKSTWDYQEDRRGYQTDIEETLAQLTPADAHDIWWAIRRARPAGLGSVPEMDILDPPPDDLIAAMRFAEQRDLVAYQFVNGFRTIQEEVLPSLMNGLRQGWTIGESIVYAHVSLMARHADSLIERKLGVEVAEQSRQKAAQALQAGPPGSLAYTRAIGDLDFWLRSDGNRRNPGTSADLIAAGLFVLLRTGQIPEPIR